jgi:hypothetical protein
VAALELAGVEVGAGVGVGSRVTVIVAVTVEGFAVIPVGSSMGTL